MSALGLCCVLYGTPPERNSQPKAKHMYTCVSVSPNSLLPLPEPGVHAGSALHHAVALRGAQEEGGEHLMSLVLVVLCLGGWCQVLMCGNECVGWWLCVVGGRSLDPYMYTDGKKRCLRTSLQW